MCQNSSPKVAMARDYSLKFNKEVVIVLSLNDQEELEVVSYGKTKPFCRCAKYLGNIAFNSICEWYEKNLP